VTISSDVITDVIVIALLLAGISQFRAPSGARLGNHAAALALAAAIFLVLYRHGVSHPWAVALSASAGALVGVYVAVRVNMTGIPAMVALQHGMGAIAAVLVSAVELGAPGTGLSTSAKVSGLFGLILGAATFSASMLAAAKLANRIKQAPTRVARHNLLLLALAILIIAISSLYWVGGSPVTYIAAGVAASTVFGLLFAIRIGGADMPVLISFLNATAGLAAAFCGVTIENRLLIVVGATIASSGSILTIMMCRAMNRNLVSVFFGSGPALANASAAEPSASPAPLPESTHAEVPRDDRLDAVAKLALAAQKIIVVPGYGMALAHAQFEVVRLTQALESMGKDVRFAIHPVAGRMPGHMNVLLAEADVDYDKLCEMDDANKEFPATDLVLVVGACDVVNPAAIDVEGTPLSGMPILMAHQARAIAVCNLDERPGYSGVPNPMYRSERTWLLMGDALQTIQDIQARLVSASASAQIAQ
jgi:NAD(P) transhydrogenase subunit beta